MAKQKKKYLVTYDGPSNTKLIIGDLMLLKGEYMIFDKLPVGQEVLDISGVEVHKLWPKEVDSYIDKFKGRR